MAEPQSNLDIEDVLASIRRLVSEGERAVRADSEAEPEPVQIAAKPVTPRRPGRLILTPAQRIGDDSDKAGVESAVAAVQALARPGAAPAPEPIKPQGAGAEGLAEWVAELARQEAAYTAAEAAGRGDVPPPEAGAPAPQAVVAPEAPVAGAVETDEDNAAWESLLDEVGLSQPAPFDFVAPALEALDEAGEAAAEEAMVSEAIDAAPESAATVEAEEDIGPLVGPELDDAADESEEDNSGSYRARIERKLAELQAELAANRRPAEPSAALAPDAVPQDDALPQPFADQAAIEPVADPASDALPDDFADFAGEIAPEATAEPTAQEFIGAAIEEDLGDFVAAATEAALADWAADAAEGEVADEALMEAEDGADPADLEDLAALDGFADAAAAFAAASHLVDDEDDAWAMPAAAPRASPVLHLRPVDQVAEAAAPETGADMAPADAALPPEAEAPSAAPLALDDPALRSFVAGILREELQGELGERITRNVRKLVRREIYRALSAEEL